jgi:hypothetical protein
MDQEGVHPSNPSCMTKLSHILGFIHKVISSFRVRVRVKIIMNSDWLDFSILAVWQPDQCFQKGVKDRILILKIMN